jgi:hypothetical protein
MRQAMGNVDVVRQIVLLIASPDACVLLEGTRTIQEPQRSDIVRKMSFIATELLLETSVHTNAVYQLILDNGLLSDLWRFVEQSAPADAVRAR